MKFASFLNIGTIAVLTLLLAPCANAQFGIPPKGSAFSISQADLMQPEELNTLMHSKGTPRPLVLQVGSNVLFTEAHILDSEYAGPGSHPAGLQKLQARVMRLDRSTAIVLYCGCCPWNRCPNIAPAFKLLQDIGFTRVKVLYLANNFGADWADKGYPIERGN